MGNADQASNSSLSRWLAILAVVVPALQLIPQFFPQGAKLHAYCTNYPPTVFELDSGLIGALDGERKQCQSLVVADVELNEKIGSVCQDGGGGPVNAALNARRVPLTMLIGGHSVDYRDYRIQDTEYCQVANDGSKEAVDVKVDLEAAPAFWIANRSRVDNTTATRTINLGSIRPGSSVVLTYVYLGKDAVSASAPVNISFPDGVGEIREGKVHFGIASNVANFVQNVVDQPLLAALIFGGCLLLMSVFVWLI